MIIRCIVRYLLFLILIINHFYYNTLKLLALHETYRITTENPQNPTEKQQNTYRIPTEYAQNTHRIPTEYPQNTHRIPTESHRKTTEYPQNPTEKQQNAHRMPTENLHHIYIKYT